MVIHRSGGLMEIQMSRVAKLSIYLSQVTSEPTNFTPVCLPSCIDLIVTDQPNLILDSVGPGHLLIQSVITK